LLLALFAAAYVFSALYLSLGQASGTEHGNELGQGRGGVLGGCRVSVSESLAPKPCDPFANVCSAAAAFVV